MEQKKRFIAGASCPNCNQSDTIKMWIENSVSFRECVECSFSDNNAEKIQAEQTRDKWQNPAINLIATDATKSN